MKKKNKYLIKELVLFSCENIKNDSDDIIRLQNIIKSELKDKDEKDKKYLILECLSCFCNEYIRLKFRDSIKNEFESNNLQNQNSLSMTVQKIETILEDFPQLMIFIIKLIQMDLFNGIFDKKYCLFKLLNETFIDNL